MIKEHFIWLYGFLVGFSIPLIYIIRNKLISRNQFFSNGCLPHEILGGMNVGDKIFIGKVLVEVKEK